MARIKQYLPRNDKYIDYLPAKKSSADIVFILNKKGVGKTYQAIREMLIGYELNNKPSMYVRTTIRQLEEFVENNKVETILNDLGYKFTRNIIVNKKGIFKIKNKTKKNSNRIKEPIIYFVAINEAMNIQSSKFKELNYLFFDEIQHHFQKSSSSIIDKWINLIASVLRNFNSKIFMMSNMVNQNDPFLRIFKLEKVVAEINIGQIKKFQRSLKINNKYINKKIAIYKPKEPSIFKKDLEESIGYFLSGLTEYGKVSSSDEFYKNLSNIKYINKHGKFKRIININGLSLGMWIKHDKNNKSIWQFSEKINNTGKTWYFSYIDYQINTLIGSLEWISLLKNKMIRHEIEFEDQFVFEKILDLFKIKT